MKKVKCVLVGDAVVGKTCLLLSFARDTFPVEYAPHIEHSRLQVLLSFHDDSDPFILDLWDTCGQADSDCIRHHCYTFADVFVICFSLTDRVSFESARDKWYRQVERHSPRVPIILVGTKLDLRENENNRTLVSYEEATDLKKEISACKYIGEF
jgi:Ras-related C3 botulinum toxin substrate 1